jgi:hypothetical protein
MCPSLAQVSCCGCYGREFTVPQLEQSIPRLQEGICNSRALGLPRRMETMQRFPSPNFELTHLGIIMCHGKLGPSGGGDQFMCFPQSGVKRSYSGIYVSRNCLLFRGSRGSVLSSERRIDAVKVPKVKTGFKVRRGGGGGWLTRQDLTWRF